MTALGDRLTFAQSLHRRSGVVHLEPIRKYWAARPVSFVVPGAQTLTGILVGVRTLADGEFRHFGSSEPFDPGEEHFVRTHHFTAYLIAYDLRRKPVLVMPDDATPEEVRP